MNEFAYKRGILHAEDVPLGRLADEVGTPLYCYSTRAIVCQYEAFARAVADMDAMICYALKANSTLAVVRTLAELGAGADVVSEGELRVALAAGIPPSRIIFSGVGKARGELEFALATGISQINVESEPELELLAELARARGEEVTVAVRINPDVDARTHAKITTGKRENKFGVPLGDASRLFARGAAMAGLLMSGVAVHIGSQIATLAPYRQAFKRIVALVKELRGDGHDIRRVDFGGGLGIAYRDETTPTVEAYAAMVKEVARGLDASFAFEPGRFLVGNAGVLVTRVLYIKEGAAHRFVIVDAAMNDLIRPTLYDAYHEIVPVAEPAKGVEFTAADVVGPVCETGDFLARNRALPPLEAGDLLAIRSAGAYVSVMASTYNSRLQAPEVMVNGARYAVVRPRPDYDALLGRDRLPDWLAERPGGSARGAA
jgi:diaminopimelate decarboxylase